MTQPTEDTHPLAPHHDEVEEGPGETHNDTKSVRMRSGVEVGAMRYVLFIGMLLAVIAIAIAIWVAPL